jgi:hypothetical protein
MPHAVPPQLSRLSDLDHAWIESNPGIRLEAVRRAARGLRDRLADGGTAVAVRTHDVATFPYPTEYGLGGAAISPAPYLMLRNRVQLVQVLAGGELVNILVNPSDPDRALAAPFFARQIERYGQLLSRRVMSQRHGDTRDALAAWGISPEEIDFVTFDHLHVQDLRGLLGTTVPEPGQSAPTRALLPNARLLAQRAELATFEHPHPMQLFWYVRDGLAGIDPQKIVALDGDYAIGAGFALVRTPGHTAGNHTPVIVTDRGLWTVSENGIAVDAYAPECSSIAGLRRHARDREIEVILNSNTREGSLDQYTAMVLEKTLADPVPERPEFPQHFCSSELVKSWMAPALAPTYSHGHITHGELRRKQPGAPRPDTTTKPSARATV